MFSFRFEIVNSFRYLRLLLSNLFFVSLWHRLCICRFFVCIDTDKYTEKNLFCCRRADETVYTTAAKNVFFICFQFHVCYILHMHIAYWHTFYHSTSRCKKYRGTCFMAVFLFHSVFTVLQYILIHILDFFSLPKRIVTCGITKT